eukprot:scaffold5075_cov174-Amphora_coffeaeformis.AAC.8
MRSNTCFSERTRVRARSERVRQESSPNAAEEAGNSSSSNHHIDDPATTHASQHEQIKQNYDYETIRNRINFHPLQPTNASYRALQSLMPTRPSGSFTPDTWWIVDRQYRPKLRHGATPLVSRCMRAYGWNESYARRVLAAYRQFLQLKTATQDWDGNHLEPSKEINRMWQQHVLDVCNYAYDCILVCGHVIGYLPDEEFIEEGRNHRRWNTKQALENIFTETDEDIWQDIISSYDTIEEKRSEKEKVADREHTQSAIHPKDKSAELKTSTTAKKGAQDVTPMLIKRPPMTRMERRARSPRKESQQAMNNIEIRKESVQEEARPFSQSPQRVRYHSPMKSRYKMLANETEESNRPEAHLSPPRPRAPAMEPPPPSQPRPKTPPVTEPHFSQIFSNAFRSLGFDTRESRTDSPTERNVADEDCAFDPLEKGEETRVDPIDIRRQAFHQESSGFKSRRPFDSPLMSRGLLQKGDFRSIGFDDRKPVTVHIRDRLGVVTSSRARRSTKLGRIFSAYAISKGVKPAHMQFFLNGYAVDSSATPASLKLRDYDRIDCVI